MVKTGESGRVIVLGFGEEENVVVIVNERVKRMKRM